MKDPMESIVGDALRAAGIKWVGETDPRSNRLDFFLPELGVHIEVKQMHASRIAEQMSRVENVIAIQGLGAARAFAMMIRKN